MRYLFSLALFIYFILHSFLLFLRVVLNCLLFEQFSVILLGHTLWLTFYALFFGYRINH